MTPAPPPKRTVDYDERVYRKGHPPHRMRNALILIVLVVIGTYLAWTKSVPFKSEYELHAVFENAANIRKDSPVRIAGVTVGEVKSIRSVGNVAVVTFTVGDEGRPVHEDAQVEIRPRIFLEGNFFLDVKSGSPNSPELPDNGTIPIAQTSTAVQLDQILTALQRPDRTNLQKVLRGYGTALNHKPTAAEDRGQDPDVQGKSAAEAINESFKYGATAARDSAIVSEALLGTEPHDLSGVLAGQARLFGSLAQQEEALKDFVTHLNTTAGAFAAESEDLAETVRLLAPTLEIATPSLRNTDRTLPFLRAFARDIRPGIAELPATINPAGPWLKQARGLLRQDELGFIADELRRAAPGAAAATAAGIPTFSQTELLSRCATNVLLPTGDVILDDSGPGYDFSTDVPNFKEFAYAAANLAGATQNFDGNGPYLRLQSGGGTVQVKAAQPTGGEFLYGQLPSAPLGTRPVLGPKPPFRTDVPCHLNTIPDLNGPAAAVGPANPSP